jgi:hypothetical protein
VSQLQPDPGQVSLVLICSGVARLMAAVLVVCRGLQVRRGIASALPERQRVAQLPGPACYELKLGSTRRVQS